MAGQQESGQVITQTLLNLTQAADAVGITRKTLYKHLGSGKLSAVRDGSGKRAVDVSELIRVYGKVQLPEPPITTGKQLQGNRNVSSEEASEAIQGMQKELVQLRELVQAMQGQQQLLLEDSRRRDEQAAELTRLQNEADELRHQLEQEKSKGFWARVFKG